MPHVRCTHWYVPGARLSPCREALKAPSFCGAKARPPAAAFFPVPFTLPSRLAMAAGLPRKSRASTTTSACMHAASSRDSTIYSCATTVLGNDGRSVQTLLRGTPGASSSRATGFGRLPLVLREVRPASTWQASSTEPTALTRVSSFARAPSCTGPRRMRLGCQ